MEASGAAEELPPKLSVASKWGSAAAPQGVARAPAPPPKPPAPAVVTSSLQWCQRVGCSAQFGEPGDNSLGSCVYHPGQPLFHDGAKVWSCCQKRSHDFSLFLTLPGCARVCGQRLGGLHLPASDCKSCES